MKVFKNILCNGLLLAAMMAALPSIAAYEPHLSQATEWLSGRQNADGSWGVQTSERFILTVEATQALRAAGIRNAAYYRGVTWLENRAAPNIDYATRRALTLGAYGANVSQVLAAVESAQDAAQSGRAGWGVASVYLQSPADTALVLNALSVIGTSTGTSTIPTQPALDYLKTAQLGGAGWPVSLESTSDPFSTALVIKGLVPWLTQDSTLAASINNGIASLTGSVNASSPAQLQALAAHAALLAGNTTTAQTWLATLAGGQAANGSWANRIYDTALVIRAFAAADGLDSPANQTGVNIPDGNLRRAINQTLGRNALDALDRTELARLTTLTANNAGIGALTGLEWAVNLTSLDVRNNTITSTAPVDGLPLITLLIDGNPVANGGELVADGDIPTLPEWGVIIMASLLLITAARRQRADRRVALQA